MPIPAARRRGGQQAFDTEWTKDRVAENETVNWWTFVSAGEPAAGWMPSRAQGMAPPLAPPPDPFLSQEMSVFVWIRYHKC